MRRMIAAVVVVGTLLAVLLGVRIAMQELALNGPAGGTGVVEGTTLRLSSRVGGRVVELGASEGQAVAPGDLLVRLDCADPTAALAAAEAQARAARQQADAAQDGATAAAAGATAAAAQARAVAAQGDAATRQAGRLDAVDDDISAAQRDQARVGADSAQAQAQAAAALSADAADAALERARLAVAECEIRAPRAGVVQLLPFEVGELTGPGAALATLLDMTEATAAFYLPNADLAAARPGGGAQVRADAWPDKVFTGTVTTVATEAEFTPRNIQTRTDRDRLVYRVEVRVENPSGELRPGMPVDVRLSGAEQ